MDPVQFNAYVHCTGHLPKDADDIQQHLAACSACKRLTDQINANIAAGAYVNRTGWWDPDRRIPYEID